MEFFVFLSQESIIFKKLQKFPRLTNTGNNIGRDWCTWKQKLLSFLQKESCRIFLYKSQLSVEKFLKVVGPLGEEAYTNLSESAHKTNLEVLLRELDIYFIFGFEKKENNENIDKYINKLMLLAIRSNHNDPGNIVKHKIEEDIKNFIVTNKAILSISFPSVIDLTSYLHSVKLDQLIKFWQRYEKEYNLKINLPSYDVTQNTQKIDF